LIVAQYLDAKAPRERIRQSEICLSSRDHRHYRFCRERALTFFNFGWWNDFVVRWWSAFAIGWPIAASTAYLAIPFARSLTQRIVAAIERT
jgi:hypothetical protein